MPGAVSGPFHVCIVCSYQAEAESFAARLDACVYDLDQANDNAAVNEAELCRLLAERNTMRCQQALFHVLGRLRTYGVSFDFRQEIDELRIRSSQLAEPSSSDLNYRVRSLEEALAFAESEIRARDEVRSRCSFTCDFASLVAARAHNWLIPVT
jgi:hypothetical protein